MTRREVLAFSIIVFLLFLGLYLFGRYRMSTLHPPFLLPKLEELINDPELMDSIGGFNSGRVMFDEMEFNVKDTLRSTIKITGKKRTLYYSTVHIRRVKDENQWMLADEKLVIE